MDYLMVYLENTAAKCLKTVWCFDESELFEEIRQDLTWILRDIDIFFKREENKELTKLRKINRLRLFNREKSALNSSIVDHAHLEYSQHLGLVCPKNMGPRKTNAVRFVVESLTNVNFEVILNTLQRLQTFVNLTLQSTTASRTRPKWKHAVFDHPLFQKDIVEQKKFDLIKYIDKRSKPKTKPKKKTPP